MSTNKLYDVVYIVKEDPDNEELRYSIRSVEENFPVRYIWIFGYCPKWLSNIIYVPVKQDGDKWSNSKKLFETIANASFLPDLSSIVLRTFDPPALAITIFSPFHYHFFPGYTYICGSPLLNIVYSFLLTELTNQILPIGLGVETTALPTTCVMF